MAPKRTILPVLPSIHHGIVTAWDASISLGVTARGAASAVLKVSLLDPIKGRTSACINVIEHGANDRESLQAEPNTLNAKITAITKDEVIIFATVAGSELANLLVLASSNRLQSCLLACQEPYRGRADIDVLSFGTQPPKLLG